MVSKNQDRNGSDEEMEVTGAQGHDSDEEGGLRIDEDIYIPPRPAEFGEVDTTGPRLMITHINNINFKSYAGEQKVGPFHKCFSAIVGPNGSGKSNVIDSMLFVFGYRASKIRSKKISVLIHNSSEHQDIKSCSVSIHFQQIIDKPGDDYEVVPDSQFVISRTAFKDNSSFYQLNGRKVQFKEIAKLLRSHGVDLDHNRFLILQGEVEQIALMKPKGQHEGDTGLLEFLEDIIGTVRYKEPLDRLNEKVEILNEKRTEKLHRLRLVEKEKKDLEEPMQDAVQYLKIENSIVKLQHQLYQRKRLDASLELKEQEVKFEALEKDYQEMMEKMKEIQKEKVEKQNNLKELSKKWDKLQEQKDATTAKFEEIRKQDQALYAESVETNNRRKENMASVKTEKAKLDELLQVPKQNTKDIKEFEEMIERNTLEKEKEEAALQNLMSSLKEKTEPLLKQRTELETKLISLKKKVNEAKAAFDIAESELQLYTSEEVKEKERLKQLQETLKTTAETLKARKGQLIEFERKIPTVEKSLADAEKRLQDLKTKEVELSSNLRNMRLQYDEQKSSMQANRSRNRLLDALLREKREGRIPGIFGRLGDLGAIDAKYDVAVSTACGPLDNIVVDTISTAEFCIKFLRENDLGRATFIPLEKQQRFAKQCRQRIETPENVARLFDLIKVEDERVLPAFYYALQNTLVANDLEQATRIAYGTQRHRVVTLKGELIELAGTMSGGGKNVSRGRMGQKVIRNEPSAEDIEKLEKELDQVFSECNQLKMQQQPLQNQIITLSSSLKDMRVDKGKFEIEVKSLSEQEPALKQQLKVQEKKAAAAVANPEKVKELKKVVECMRKKLEEAEESSKSMEEKVANINHDIEKISGNRVKEQQKKIAGLNKAIEKAKAEICRLQVAIKTAERNSKKTQQRIETLENDVLTCQDRIRAIGDKKKELEVVAAGLLEELEKLREALVERDEATGDLKEELNKLQANESELKATKIDQDQKMNEIRKTIKELSQRIPDLTRKIAIMKLHAIPEMSQEELKELSEEEVQELDAKILANNLQKVKEKLPEEIPNMQYIKDYQEKDQIYLRRVAELDEITTVRNKLLEVYEDAKRRRMEEFRNGFGIITTKLKEMYQMITLGGDAELELVDSLDPFSEGIVFSVRPPKKSWKNISNLSGGEKTLSSLALVFALHHYKPTPFYFMDEIDAALDFKNVSIVGNYIKERTKNAQFIVISLRSNMFELANYLVGIYKTYNCTKCATLDLTTCYQVHGITPPNQFNNMTKNRFLTQSQKVISSPIKSQKSVGNELRSVQTCPSRIGDREESPEAEPCLGFPDLLLSLTPQKSSQGNERSSLSFSEDRKGGEAESSSRTEYEPGPDTKKRKVMKRRS